MLEKALFVTKLFLDGWEKLLLEDVFVSLKKFLLKLTELWDQGTTSAELAQEWQQACLSEAKTFGGWPGVKKASKEATYHQEKHQGKIDILQKVQRLHC